MQLSVLYDVTRQMAILMLITSMGLISQNGYAAEAKKSENTANTTSPAKHKSFIANDEFSLHSSALRDLMLTLYQCNPHELQKSTKVSKEEFVQWVFEGPFGWKFDAIRNKQTLDALSLSLNPEYQADRVLPLVTGLYTMILNSYGGETEYRFTQPINPNILLTASQNVDISAIKLLNIKRDNGEAYIADNCKLAVKQSLNDISQHISRNAQNIAKETKQAINFNTHNLMQIENKNHEFIQF